MFSGRFMINYNKKCKKIVINELLYPYAVTPDLFHYLLIYFYNFQVYIADTRPTNRTHVK